MFLVWYQTFARHPRAESDGKEKEKILKKSLRLSVKMNFVDQKIFLGSADNESSNRVRKVKRKTFGNEKNVSIKAEKKKIVRKVEKVEAQYCAGGNNSLGPIKKVLRPLPDTPVPSPAEKRKKKH